MNNVVQIILACSAVVTATGAIGAMLELRSLRNSLIGRGQGIEAGRGAPKYPNGSQSARPDRGKDGYAIYVYKDSAWVLEHDLSAPGFRPVPPRLEGAYEGQALRVAAVADGPR